MSERQSGHSKLLYSQADLDAAVQEVENLRAANIALDVERARLSFAEACNERQRKIIRELYERLAEARLTVHNVND